MYLTMINVLIGKNVALINVNQPIIT